jgi:hypothetical protein
MACSIRAGGLILSEIASLGVAMPSILSVRIDPATSAALTAAAISAETSVSGFARAAIANALPENSALSPLPFSPPRRPRHLPEPDVAAVASILAAINRLNGAMVQFSKALREAGHVLEHRAMEAAIGGVLDLKAEGIRLFRKLQG